MTRYLIRVSGSLSEDLLTAMPTLSATVEPATTVLEGELPDQAALTGVLDRLDELGVEIVDLSTLPADRRTSARSDDAMSSWQPEP